MATPSAQVFDHALHQQSGAEKVAATTAITFGLVGSGGDGVMTAGEIAESALSSCGLYCMLTKSYGPQIRGGEAYVQVRTSTVPLLTEGDTLDLLVILSWKDFGRFRGEIKLRPGAVVIVDSEDKSRKDGQLPDGAGELTVLEVPFTTLARSSGSKQNKNMIFLGILSVVAKVPEAALRAKLEARFAKKGEKIVQTLTTGIEVGLAHARESIDERLDFDVPEQTGKAKCVLTGNEAIALGALHAGCRFFAGYPITPSTEVLDMMSRYLPRFGGRCVQAEDEISAIGMCVGASFAGAKAMTSTSGPGLSLMSEIMGLAAMAELPLVIANVQRGGPSTGIPTKSEQSDLLHAAFGGHGDATRVVIAPTDVEDCFDVTVKAFFIAERYQLPVIVLSDQLIGQRKEAIDREGIVNDTEGFVAINERHQPESCEDGFKRFAITPDDVPLITNPGTPGGTYQISGLEHDGHGRPTSSYVWHDKISRRRARKLERIADEFRFLRWIGPKEADLGLVAWGSSKGVVKEAVFRAIARGWRVAAFIPQIIYPVPAVQLGEFIEGMGQIAVLELSVNKQFHQLLQSAVNLPDDTISYARPGGNPLRVDEVLDVIAKALGHQGGEQ